MRRATHEHKTQSFTKIKLNMQNLCEDLYYHLFPLVSATRAQANVIVLTQEMVYRPPITSRRPSQRKSAIEVFLKRDDLELCSFSEQRIQKDFLDEASALLQNRGFKLAKLTPNCIFHDETKFKLDVFSFSPEDINFLGLVDYSGKDQLGAKNLQSLVAKNMILGRGHFKTPIKFSKSYGRNLTH
eukprot:TRINITY_DN19486_c0_g1_i1.p1 TRINITY_DN19486_c0_g1~~TRINITY_DN19486_c0_g1_i1.p1  ORF type:complete len:185 (+),score=2.42 TRINITY_DN19486_c0_g1_i1:114-668(+)